VPHLKVYGTFTRPALCQHRKAWGTHTRLVLCLSAGTCNQSAVPARGRLPVAWGGRVLCALEAGLLARRLLLLAGCRCWQAYCLVAGG
jgi:hypothetical protein